MILSKTTHSVKLAAPDSIDQNNLVGSASVSGATYLRLAAGPDSEQLQLHLRDNVFVTCFSIILQSWLKID